MNTAFAFEVRVVPCTVCGAPLALGAAGGRQGCTHCGAEQQAVHGARSIPRSPAVAEAARLDALRQQDRHAPATPPEVADCFADTELLPWKVGAALGHWQRARHDLAVTPNPDAERLLHRLTLGLAEHFEYEGDALRTRSLLEGALDVAREKRSRQALCAALARSACTAGDLQAAQAWLDGCDPTPDDLASDTAYRFASALVDTTRGDFQAVVNVLGTDHEAVPLDDEHEPACAALRAHCLERLGRSDLARESLSRFFQASTPLARYLCLRFVERRSDPLFCQPALRFADERQRSLGAGVAARRAGIPLVALLLAGGFFGLAGLSAAGLAWFGQHELAHVCAGLIGFIGVPFVAIGVDQLRKRSRAVRLRRRGVPAVARIVHARSTGVATKGDPELVYRVLVLPARGFPFFAHSVVHPTAVERQRLRPGAVTVVRMDPNAHDLVQLELD